MCKKQRYLRAYFIDGAFVVRDLESKSRQEAHGHGWSIQFRLMCSFAMKYWRQCLELCHCYTRRWSTSLIKNVNRYCLVLHYNVLKKSFVSIPWVQIFFCCCLLSSIIVDVTLSKVNKQHSKMSKWRWSKIYVAIRWQCLSRFSQQLDNIFLIFNLTCIHTPNP